MRDVVSTRRAGEARWYHRTPMFRLRWPLGAAALAALALAAAGCGATRATLHPMTATASTQARRTAQAAHVVAPFVVRLVAPTHTPKVNAPWPITIRVSDRAGHPLRARLTMQILYQGMPVGKVDNGRAYVFVGIWREKPGQEITWPASSRGQQLTFRAVVTAKGATRNVDYWIRVR